MKVGVTGTRSGMSEAQYLQMSIYLSLLPVGSELHHGDCVGVDVEVATMAKDAGLRIVCHPPIKEELRAFHASDEILEPLTHFARNRNIVDSCDVLLVVPYQTAHQNTGGTWYTHDYAVKKNKPVKIFNREE